LLKQFSQTMEAVLELLDTVSPHVVDLDERSQGASVSLPPPPPEGAELLVDTFNRLQAEREDAAEEDEGRDPIALSNEQVAELAGAFKKAYEDPEALRAIGEALITVSTRPRREHLLHGALLTMAIGTLETAIAGVATQHFTVHPEALPGAEKEFSLADLADFENLADARALAISRRVEDLMRSGFKSWDSWFSKLLGADFQELAADRDVLAEAIQRRHLVVHNGGRVSRQYKAKVPTSEAEVGEELPIDRAYLETAIDAVTIFGVRLILIAWSKWRPGDPGAGNIATDLVYEQLEHGRLEVARCVAKSAGSFVTKEHQRLSLQVNGWQASKRLKGLDAIKDEVEAWDTTALKGPYMAAKAALLENYDELFALLPMTIERKELEPVALREWPLFKEARERDEWDEIEALLPTPATSKDNGDEDPRAKLPEEEGA
jgi:hypothetical protein